MTNEISEHRQEYLDAIIDAINASVESYTDDAKDNPLCGDAHYYMFEDKRSVKAFSFLLNEHHSEELKNIVESFLAKGINESLIIEALKESVKIDVRGIYVPNNSVESWTIGEQEYQFEELNSLDVTDDEREYLAKNLDCYWDEKSDCVYVDMTYDVIWMTCDPAKLKREINKLIKESVRS